MLNLKSSSSLVLMAVIDAMHCLRLAALLISLGCNRMALMLWKKFCGSLVAIFGDFLAFSHGTGTFLVLVPPTPT